MGKFHPNEILVTQLLMYHHTSIIISVPPKLILHNTVWYSWILLQYVHVPWTYDKHYDAKLMY